VASNVIEQATVAAADIKNGDSSTLRSKEFPEHAPFDRAFDSKWQARRAAIRVVTVCRLTVYLPAH
jgi:hypothetical protein